jgi:hypothetical protein
MQKIDGITDMDVSIDLQHYLLAALFIASIQPMCNGTLRYEPEIVGAGFLKVSSSLY